VPESWQSKSRCHPLKEVDHDLWEAFFGDKT